MPIRFTCPSPPLLPQDILTIRGILDAAGAQHVKVGCLLLLRVCLLVCLLAFVSACLSVCLLVCLLALVYACLFVFFLLCLLAFVSTCLFVYLLLCLLACLLKLG